MGEDSTGALTGGSDDQLFGGVGSSGRLSVVVQGWLPLARKKLVGAVREALGKAGINQNKYSGHSFRIEAATTATPKGLEGALIKTLERWRSLQTDR